MGATKQQSTEMQERYTDLFAGIIENNNYSEKDLVLNEFIPKCKGDRQKEEFVHMYARLDRNELINFTLNEHSEYDWWEYSTSFRAWKRDISAEILKYRLKINNWL